MARKAVVIVWGVPIPNCRSWRKISKSDLAAEEFGPQHADAADQNSSDGTSFV